MAAHKPLRLPTQFEERSREKPEPKSSNQTAVLIVVGAIVVTALLVIGVVYLNQRDEVHKMAEAKAFVEGELQALREQLLSQPTPAPTATPVPTCDPYTGEIGTVNDLVSQGKFAMAAEIADLNLSNTKLPPCPSAKLSLAALSYTAALDDLFATRGLDGREALIRWQKAEAKADANSLPPDKRWSSMTVVTQAYNAGLWPLARAAFQEAWTNGTLDHTDLKQIHLIYAILRNYGYLEAHSADRETRQAGLVLLRTADEISRAYGLAAGEAHQDLVSLLGADVSKWPGPDTSDPVLQSVTEKKGER